MRVDTNAGECDGKSSGVQRFSLVVERGCDSIIDRK